METIDHIEHAVTLDVMESEENSRHSITYPGVYLCRFENSFSVQLTSADERYSQTLESVFGETGYEANSP